MKRIIAFAGLPAVGKSTISQAVSVSLEAPIIDIDQFKKAVVDAELVREQIDPPEVRWSYYQKSLEHAVALLEQGATNVIMDEVFHVQSLRAKFEEYCAERQIQVVWVEVICSYEVVETRLREKGRENHILSTDEALIMHKRFKKLFEPFEAGHHILLDNTNGVEPLVHLLLEALQ